MRDQRDYLNFRSIFIVALSLLSVLATVSFFSPYLGIIQVHAQGTLMASPNPLVVDLGSNTFTSTITVSGFTGAVTLAAVASTTNPPPGQVVFSLDSSSVTGSGTVHLLVSDSDFTTPFPPGGDINVTATPTGSAVPTEFVPVGLTLTIPADRAQIVLECQGLIPSTPNCSSTSILPFESIVYDANDNAIFDAGDQIIAGPLPPVGTHLANDAKLQWQDVNNVCASIATCHWASAPDIDPIFYNTNGTVGGRVFLFGPMTTLTSAVHGTTGTCTVASTCADLKLRFAQTDECGTVACATLQGVVEVKAKLVNVGGILADGSEQDVLAQQIIYSFNPGVLQALCSASPCGSTLSGQFDQFCALQSSATGGSVCGSPLTGRFTFVVDSYCTNSGGSVLDTISVDNSNGKISSSSLCSQGPPANNDTGIGCDPNYTDTNRIGTCPGDITKGPAGAPNPPLSNVTSTIVEFIVGIGSTPVTNVASAPGVSGSSLADIDGASSSNVPVVLVSSSFNNGATHSTTASVSCLPSSVAVNTTTTCTATVTDPATSGIVTPAGTVTFAITTGTGSFNVPTCTLAAGTYAAGSITPSTSCSVVYKPSQIGTGSHTLSESFGGDSSHTTSSSAAVVAVTPLAGAPTSTVVTCVPASVTVNTGSVCTATVTDTSASPTTPTGSVGFTTDGTGTFTLPGTSCSLSAGTVAGTASCQVTYTPTIVGTGTHSITGTYAPTSNHAASHGSFALTVAAPAAHPTSTSVDCVPASVTVSTGTVCTATVTDTSATGATTPTGSVGFASDGTGSFTPATSCSLSAGTTAGTATCQVTYTPTVVGTGTHTITGTFVPTSNHAASHGTFALTVTPPPADPTTTSVNCVPASVTVNSGSLCTATVTDSSATGATTPAGSVSFTSDGTGSFTPATSCNLSAGTTAGTATCQVTYTPTLVGAGTHAITGTFVPTSNHLASHRTFALTVTALTAGPDFTLTASPTSVTVSVGVAGTSTIAVGPLNGFTGDVSLTSDNASCSLTPATVSGGSGTSTLSCTFSTTGSFVVTVTGTSGSLVHTATVDFTVTATAGFDLSWQGYDWDGGHEATLYFNGQFLTSLPPVDTPSTGGAWASFSFDITSYIVNGTNTLTFTHANWDCSVSDTVGNLQVTSGTTVVYSNSTSLPLTCTQWLTYTFMVGTAPPPPPPPELSISAGQSTAFPVVGETLTFSALSSGGVPPYMFTWNFGDGATGVGSTVNHEYAAPGTYAARATVTDSASRPDTSFVDIIVTVSAPSSSPGTYILSWQGYDWDGGQEETLTINGQMVATLPPVDTPSNGGAWASFSFDITSYVVKGTNTLTFTHANWDCPISDSVRNLQLTNGTTVVYGNATVSPLACSQLLTYTFSV